MSELPLEGARIWLSGAMPNSSSSTEAERASIAEFVQRFALRVFRNGGHIIHGGQPEFTKILLSVAKEHKRNGGKKDCLKIAVSQYFSLQPEIARTVSDWKNSCLVCEVPQAEDISDREASLALLRDWLAESADAFVAVGGKWDEMSRGKAGVPQELQRALKRHIPAFVLGGFGGAAKRYLDEQSHTTAMLRNGLSGEENLRLSGETNVDLSVEVIGVQLERLPLVRGTGTDGSSFRILALDGGGLKGAFTAAALASWEELTGVRVVDSFDLIAGTSTGGILAVGLGLGISAKDMLDFYLHSGTTIFPTTGLVGRWWHRIRHLFCPAYSQKTLYDILKSKFYPNGKTRYVSDSLCRLVIPSYHSHAGRTYVFRTNHAARLVADAHTEAAFVALATASAPTFFAAAPIASLGQLPTYIDGGVWANNPLIAGIVEAVCYLKRPMDRLEILSVGTTSSPFSASKQVRAGAIRWSLKLISLLMEAQDDSNFKQAELLVGRERLLRVDHVVARSRFSLDGAKKIRELASLGKRAAEDPGTLAQVQQRFFNGIKVNPWEKY